MWRCRGSRLSAGALWAPLLEAFALLCPLVNRPAILSQLFGSGVAGVVVVVVGEQPQPQPLVAVGPRRPLQQHC